MEKKSRSSSPLAGFESGHGDGSASIVPGNFGKGNPGFPKKFFRENVGS